MKTIILIVVCVAVMSCVSANPTPESSEWKVLGKAQSDKAIEFSVALKQNEKGVALLEKLFWEITDPSSEKYREWLTIDQVMAYTAPLSSVQHMVAGWLRTTGLKAELFGDFITVSGTVGQTASLFKVDLYEISHPRLAVPYIRSIEDLVVPSHIQEAIDFVAGLTTDVLPLPRSS